MKCGQNVGESFAECGPSVGRRCGQKVGEVWAERSLSAGSLWRKHGRKMPVEYGQMVCRWWADDVHMVGRWWADGEQMMRNTSR